MRRLPVLFCLALIGALTTSSSARAQTTITPSRILVSGRGAVAVIDQHPFRLQIGTTAGRLALAEVLASDGPVRLAGLADPVAPGYEPRLSGQRYAPLSFLVGTQTITQYDGGIWGGNLQSGRLTGVQYAARSVITVVPRGSGVMLTLSTDDPSGRTLRVKVMPAGPGLIEISVVPHPATGVAGLSDSFSSPGRESFYGFGGRHNALDQRGQALVGFVQEENLPHSGSPGTPAGILNPNGATAAYYPQAQFISSRGYGFLLDQPQLARFRLDSDRSHAWSVSVAARSLSYLVAPGATGRAVAALTAVSGRQPAPPAWALGPMLDRLVKNVGETETDYERQLGQDMAEIVRYHLPLTAYRIEGWGFPGTGNDGLALHSFVSFATQSAVIARLRARHIHPLAYLRPWIIPGSRPDRDGLTVRRPGGRTYVTSGTVSQRVALLDFTNPAAVRYWRREIAKVLDLGFDGFMADFGEEVVPAMRFRDGETGAAMHNRYLVLYMRATRQAVAAYQRRHPFRHPWFFNRAGYSGTPGSAAYESGNFPGDETTDWSQAAGLRSLAPDMLGRAVGGAYGFGTDIGGYFDLNTPPTTKELFLRWAEWAALSPIFRLHGSGLAGTHTPWSYDAQTLRTYVALSRLHERAAPLILRLWRDADRTGTPPIRPLWLAYPADPRAAAQEQEWMLGPDVLVAPVVDPGARARRVYFPAGCWRDPHTARAHRGRGSAELPAPLTRLPFFFRCGTRPF